MNEILYTTDDLSKMFRVGKSTIKRWTDEGKLQCFKTPGGHRKFKPSNVQEFIIHYHYEVSATELPDGALNADSVSAAFGPNVEECFASAVKGLRQPIEHSFSALFAQGKSLPVIFDSPSGIFLNWILTSCLHGPCLDRHPNRIDLVY